MLHLELFIRLPRLEGETQTSESLVTVPTGTTTSSQAGKEIRSGCRTERHLCDQKTSSFQTSRGSRIISVRDGAEIQE
jgi:hypothetical protein